MGRFFVSWHSVPKSLYETVAKPRDIMGDFDGRHRKTGKNLVQCSVFDFFGMVGDTAKCGSESTDRLVVFQSRLESEGNRIAEMVNGDGCGPCHPNRSQ